MAAVPSLAVVTAERIHAAVHALVPDATGFDPAVRRSAHADLQADGLLAFGRTTRRNPRELATAVAAALAGDAVSTAVAGPGFLNLTVPDDALLDRVAQRLADPRLGVGTPERGRTTVIDYSQPNIAKELHVGHLRSTVIGDALVRVLEHLGGTVLRHNHIGDWGTQFGMLIQYLMEHPTDGDRPTIGRLAELYRTAQARFTADDTFADRARRRVVALQAGDPPTRAIWATLVAESTAYFTAVYERLGVRLTPADAVGESFYNPMLDDVAVELERTGVAVRSDGALCVFLPDVPAPLIVRKGDGGFGYPATDLAALRYRAGPLAADRILYVVDARQSLHLRMVFDTARRAGWVPAGTEVTHVPFGTVLGADGRPLRTRSGDPARLLDLLTEAEDRAARDNPPELARQVGVGAVKYADLATNRARDYRYDPDRMLSLVGNTSVYLQYAQVRVRSILAKAPAGPQPPPAGPQPPPAGPLAPAERALALDLDSFGDILAEVVASYEPHRLCTYLYGLAQAFTAFYENCPVLTAPPERRGTRLALCRLTGDTLRTGLDLLGIAAPDRL